MKLFKGKIGHISYKSHRKSGKLYRGSQEAEKKKTPCPKLGTAQPQLVLVIVCILITPLLLIIYLTCQLPLHNYTTLGYLKFVL